MARLAREVVVDEAQRVLTIDGETFAWHIAPGVNVRTDYSDGISYVAIEVLARHVRITGRDTT